MYFRSLSLSRDIRASIGGRIVLVTTVPLGSHTIVGTMSFSPLLRNLSKIPTPLFGNAATAVAWTSQKVKGLPRFAPWGLPAFVGVMWFVWPAVDDGWKIEMGFLPDPEAAKAAAPAAAPEPVKLSEEASEKVMTAHKPEVHELTADEKAVVKAVSAGDFSSLEKEWDTFAEKAMNPEDDDDDDDDEDEEDEEEEEEEEEEEDE